MAASATARPTSSSIASGPLAPPRGSEATQLILVRWLDQSLGGSDGGSIVAGHGMGISTSPWTPAGSMRGTIETYTDPAGKKQKLLVAIPLENLSGSGLQVGLVGPLGTYTLHVPLASGPLDIPITLTQEVVDLQRTGPPSCPVRVGDAPLVLRFDPSTVSPGGSSTLALSGSTTACDRVVITLAALVAGDGRVHRATGPTALAVHPLPLRWTLPADLARGSYTALVWYPLAWRLVTIEVR